VLRPQKKPSVENAQFFLLIPASIFFLKKPIKIASDIFVKFATLRKVKVNKSFSKKSQTSTKSAEQE
jgi:hypothetical protein